MIRELFAKNTSILRKIGFNKFNIMLIFCLFVFTTGSTSSFGIRPVISLKLGYQFESGTGTETDPYIVD